MLVLLLVLGCITPPANASAVSIFMTAEDFASWAEPELSLLDSRADKALFLCKLAENWRSVNKDKAAEVLNDAFEAALLVEDEEARIRARTMETESIYLDPAQRDETLSLCGLIFEKTRPVRTILAIAEVWVNIDPSKADEPIRRALALARKNRAPWLWDIETRNIAVLRARRDVDAAVDLAETIKSPQARAYALVSIAGRALNSGSAQAHEIYGLAWRTSVQIMDPGIRISVQAQIGSAWSALSPETGSRIFEEALKAAYNLDDPKEKALGIIAIGLQWGKWAPDKIFSLASLIPPEMVAERLVLFLSTAGETPAGETMDRLIKAALQKARELPPGLARDEAFVNIAQLVASDPDEAMSLLNEINPANESARSRVLAAAAVSMADDDFKAAIRTADNITDRLIKIRTFIRLVEKNRIEDNTGRSPLELIEEEIQGADSARIKIEAATAWTKVSAPRAWSLIDDLEDPSERAVGYRKLAVRFWNLGRKDDAEQAWRLAVETVGSENLESGLIRAGLLNDIAISMVQADPEQANAVFEVARRIAAGQ